MWESTSRCQRTLAGRKNDDIDNDRHFCLAISSKEWIIDISTDPKNVIPQTAKSIIELSKALRARSIYSQLSVLTDTSIRQTPRYNGQLVLAFLYSFYLTLFKTDISLRWTQYSAGPKGVRLRESWVVNPNLSPNSDPHRISPNNNTAWSNKTGYDNEWNDHQRWNVVMLEQILSSSIISNVWRKVWRRCMLMLGLKVLKGI